MLKTNSELKGIIVAAIKLEIKSPNRPSSKKILHLFLIWFHHNLDFMTDNNWLN